MKVSKLAWLSACFTATMNSLALPVSMLAAGPSCTHMPGTCQVVRTLPIHRDSELLSGLPGRITGWPGPAVVTKSSQEEPAGNPLVGFSRGDQAYRAQRRDSTGSPSWLAAPAPRQGLLRWALLA